MTGARVTSPADHWQREKSQDRGVFFMYVMFNCIFEHPRATFKSSDALRGTKKVMSPLGGSTVAQ